MENISVIGCGYIGLPVSLFLAASGYNVLGVDIDLEKIEKLRKGTYVIDEPGFPELWNKAKNSGKISFSNEINPSDIYIIAVPTPIKNKAFTADLSFVIDAVKSFLPLLKEKDLIILESTVPPLTCRKLILNPIKENFGLNFSKSILIAHCPERVFPGNLIYEFIHNDRLIGGINVESKIKAKKIYETFVKGKLILTDDTTAEFVKILENTYRMINIAFAFEIEKLAKSVNIDINKAITYANYHPRVNILRPSIGVGGHCIPVDPAFLVELNPDKTPLINQALKIIQKQPKNIVERLISYFKENSILKDHNILLVGKAYKKDVKDERNSPSLEIYTELKEKKYRVTLYDPLFDKYIKLVDLANNFNVIVILMSHTIIINEIENEMEVITQNLLEPKVLINDVMNL